MKSTCLISIKSIKLHYNHDHGIEHAQVRNVFLREASRKETSYTCASLPHNCSPLIKIFLQPNFRSLLILQKCRLSCRTSIRSS
jgi:hypothetical protein